MSRSLRPFFAQFATGVDASWIGLYIFRDIQDLWSRLKKPRSYSGYLLRCCCVVSQFNVRVERKLSDALRGSRWGRLVCRLIRDKLCPPRRITTTFHFIAYTLHQYIIGHETTLIHPDLSILRCGSAIPSATWLSKASEAEPAPKGQFQASANRQHSMCKPSRRVQVCCKTRQLRCT